MTYGLSIFSSPSPRLIPFRASRFVLAIILASFPAILWAPGMVVAPAIYTLDQDALAHGKEVEAEVVGFEERIGKTGIAFLVTLRYRVDGQVYETTMDNEGYTEGERVTIVYPPLWPRYSYHPKDYKYLRPLPLWSVFVCSIVPTVLGLLLTLIMFRENYSLPRYLLEHGQLAEAEVIQGNSQGFATVRFSTPRQTVETWFASQKKLRTGDREAIVYDPESPSSRFRCAETILNWGNSSALLSIVLLVASLAGLAAVLLTLGQYANSWGSPQLHQQYRQARVEMRQIEEACQRFIDSNERLPEGFRDLEEEGEDLPREDPWGQKYSVRKKSVKGREYVQIWCGGTPDKQSVKRKGQLRRSVWMKKK